MSKYCPSCGAEVKQGYKFCLSCGAQLKGASAQPSPSQTQVPPPQDLNQPQAYTPMQPKKTNMKLIGMLVAIIVIIIVVVAIVLIFLGGGATDSRFVGEWEQFSDYTSITWDFKSGGDLYIMSVKMGTWSVSGDQLCISPSSEWGGSTAKVCYNFEFSDNGNKMTLSILNEETLTLTKK